MNQVISHGRMGYGKVPGINKRVSRLVQGTMMVDGSDSGRDFALLDGVFEQGCTTFDTAHGYGAGACERAFGEWLEARGLREQVVILGKGAHHNEDRKRVTPFDIEADLHDSLARLRVDDVDLYVLHRDDPSAPVGPIVDVLNRILDEGLIHAFGGSNWSHDRIEEANAYAQRNGLVPFVASSPNFSLAEQVQAPWPDCVSISGEGGAAARAYYRNTRLAVFTWSSLAGGFFSGRFRRDNLKSFTSYFDKVCVNSYASEENFGRLGRAEQLAADKGLSLPQVALAYVLSQPFNLFALVGCRTPEEFAQNVVALQVELTPDELAWLEGSS